MDPGNGHIFVQEVGMSVKKINYFWIVFCDAVWLHKINDDYLPGS